MDLLAAIKKNNLKEVKEIIKNNMISEEFGLTCLEAIVENNSFEILDFFIKNKIIITRDENNDFYIDDNCDNFIKAIQLEFIETINVFLKYNPDYPLFHNHTPFNVACEQNNTEIVKLFLKNKKLNVSTASNFAFRHSASCGSFDIVKLLLEDFSVNPLSFTNEAIQMAYKNEHFDIVSYLWENKRVKDTLQKDDLSLYNILITKEVKEKVGNF